MSERLALHLSGILRRIEPRAGSELESAVTALFAGLEEGHVCLDRTLFPEIGTLLPALAGLSSIVGRPGEFRPLIVEDDRLYLARYWAYETGVAEALRRLARPAEPAPDPVRLEELINTVFGGETPDPHQAAAVRGAARRNLAIISGGPGTGKTTTVAKILAVRQMLAPAGAPLRIALAAPTGKAADRLRRSVAVAKRSLRVPDSVKALIPEEASTLHRLLGIRSGSRASPGPLLLDLLVIDEASMIDLSLMAKVLEALPPGAGLILLGDRDQLDAVQPGSVFGDLCGTEEPGILRESFFPLVRSYRFDSTSGIGSLARRVNEGDSDGAMQVLRTDRSGEVVWMETEHPAEDPRLSGHVLEWLRPYFGLVRRGASADECAEQFNRARLLTPLRDAPANVGAMNDRILELLRADAVDVAEWYPGRPVLVTVNSYPLRLFNGDVGITLRGADGRYGVVFPGEGETWRSVSPARLPSHEPAYALTVHKSQGSEFDDVLFLVPSGENPVITRNLLYTGITRARKRCLLWGSEAAIRLAITRRPIRASGLSDRLR